MFFFFLFHHVLKIFPENYLTDLKRNCLTVIFGSICYFLLYGYLVNVQSSSWFHQSLKDWYWYFVIIDLVLMGIIYRNHYGRSIIFEMGDDDPSKWEYDEKTHKYNRSEQTEREEFFAHKMDVLEQADETLQGLKDHQQIMQETAEQLKDIQDTVDELDMAVKYAPGGELAKKFEQDFNDKLKTL